MNRQTSKSSANPRGRLWGMPAEACVQAAALAAPRRRRSPGHHLCRHVVVQEVVQVALNCAGDGAGD